jgi:hypothetical protein
MAAITGKVEKGKSGPANQPGTLEVPASIAVTVDECLLRFAVAECGVDGNAKRLGVFLRLLSPNELTRTGLCHIRHGDLALTVEPLAAAQLLENAGLACL